MKNKKSIVMMIAFAFMAFVLGPNTYASSISINAYQTLEIGGTTNITITGSDATGRINVSSSNSGIVALSAGSVWVENGSSIVTATAKAAGTATITIRPEADNLSNGSGDDVSGTVGSKSITIKVNAPATNTSTGTTTTKTTTTTTKSNNANLSKLVANYEGLSPNFNSSVTKYALTVPSTADSIKFTVATAGTGAKYYIDGDKNLKLGDNTVTVTVTAADGTKKVYTIIVTKADDVKKANAYLSSIVIDGYPLSPVFAAETLDYDIGTVKADITKLTVLAYAQSGAAKIGITGNEALVDGQNVIKIKVTAEDGVTTKEYTVKVTKEAGSAKSEVNVYNDSSNSLKNTEPSKISKILAIIKWYLKNYWLVLSLFACCIFEFVQIVIFYKKYYKLYKAEKDEEKGKKKVNIDIPLDAEELPSRRRNQLLEESSMKNDVKKENELNEKVDDITDELVDKTEKVEEDDLTDNFEDTKDEEK